MRETESVRKALDKARCDGLLTEGPPVRLPTCGSVSSPPPAGISEKDFQQRVILFAKAHGWHVHHARPARMVDGDWRTPIMGDPGFPDLVLARAGVVILAELKSEKGSTMPAQDAWLDALAPREGNAPIVVLWRPSMMEQIEKVLA